MRLYFIRHGQSENNLLWDETGSNRGRSEDPELTPTGRRQAQLLAEFIHKKNAEIYSNGTQPGVNRDLFAFTHLYTSLMVRSVATGTYVSETLGIPLQGWPEIHECGGIFLEDHETGEHRGLPGKSRSYFLENYSNLVVPEVCTDDGWWNRPFEAHEDRPLRAKAVLSMLLERHGGTDDRVAIVSHGGFYVELFRVMFKVEGRDSWFLMNNTAVSRFDFLDSGEISLVYHNRTDHLPGNLIT